MTLDIHPVLRRPVGKALFLALLLSLAPTGRAVALSRSDEIRLGQRAAAEIERKYRTRQDPLVSRIGHDIAAASDAPDMPYRFRVIEMKGANAFALPGGPVYVTADLLEMTGSDPGELAGVLGHEVAHITLRHAARQIERPQWLGVGVRVLTGGTSRTIANLAANLIALRYSRGQEYDADRKGAQYARRAGHDPAGLVRFLDRLAGLEGSGASIPWLRSHPGTRARAERLRKLIGLSRPSSALPDCAARRGGATADP